MLDVAYEVLNAEQRIRPYIRETMLAYSLSLSRPGGPDVYCKLENLQHTGSFKARGAMNKLLSLPKAVLAQGIVTASTGNHGAAVAWSASMLGAQGIVFVPHGSSPTKLAAIERLGAQVRLYGHDCAEAESFARGYAAEQGLAYVSPYNDPQVVGGQGTIGVELLRQLDGIGTVYVSLGGGGLISGVAGYLKSVRPEIRVVGCSPENSQVMIQSVAAGEILDLPSLPTLSDGTAGGIEPESITFDLCRRWVDDYVTVSEGEIRACLRSFIETHHVLIEGAAAVAVASYLKDQGSGGDRSGNAVIVICGANISLETLKGVL